MKQTEYIKKDDALEYVLENYYDEVQEAVLEDLQNDHESMRDAYD